MILEINHKTLYRYGAPVVQSQHLVHMTPRAIARQNVRHHSLIVEPAPASRYDGLDAFGNPVVILDIEVPHREFVLHARSTIETTRRSGLDLSASAPWDRVQPVQDTTRGLAGDGQGQRLPPVDLDIVQYRCPSRLTPASRDIADYASVSFTPGRPAMEAAYDLIKRIHDEFIFDPTATDISTPISEVLRLRRGVCQDFSHLTLAALRALGIPARYVSGYLLTRPPPGQKKLQGTDASHAWVSAWSPETGWVDFDPTNGLVVLDEHAGIAYGRDYDDVSPIRGVLLGGGAHTVTVGVDVREA